MCRGEKRERERKREVARKIDVVLLSGVSLRSIRWRHVEVSSSGFSLPAQLSGQKITCSRSRREIDFWYTRGNLEDKLCASRALLKGCVAVDVPKSPGVCEERGEGSKKVLHKGGRKGRARTLGDTRRSTNDCHHSSRRCCKMRERARKNKKEKGERGTRCEKRRE